MTPDASLSLGQRPPLARLMADVTSAHDHAAAASSWLAQNVAPGMRLAVAVDDRHPAAAAVLSAASAHMIRCETQSATVENRAREWSRNFLHSLLRHAPMATSIERPLQGRAAVIVGAGPSLDANGHVLAELQDRGACVIAVNTSAGACVRNGCLPHLVVCVENRDVSSGLAATGGQCIHVMSMTAAPINWDVPSQCNLAITNHEPALVPYTLRLGGVPLPYTYSVSCAAASLAHLWGAGPIILMGQDLAPLDSRLYAQGSPFDDVVCTYDGDTVESRGKSKSVIPLPLVQAPGWHGTDVRTTHTFALVREWFAKLASMATILNATEGGLHIPGTLRLTASQTARAIDQRPPLPPLDPRPSEGHERVREDLCGRARDTLAAAPLSVPVGFPLLGLWVAPEIVRLNRTTHDPRERVDAFRAAVATGCHEILEILEAG